MNSDSLLPLAGLLAIPAAAVFYLSRGEPFILVAMLNTVLIVGSLLYVFVAELEGGHGEHSDHGGAEVTG
jgi:hypothetical protein